MQKYLTESLGTFFLVLVVGLTGNPLAIGAVLAAMVYMGGYISGAHYNPAVTFAVWLQKKITSTQAAYYVLYQLAGALLAVGAYQAITSGKMAVSPAEGVSFGSALLVEIIFTFALASVVLHTALSKKTKGNDYYGLAIGLVLVAAAFAGGPISGGAYNPAVGLVPNVFDSANLGDQISNLWLYSLGPLAGGLIAGLAFGSTEKA